MRPLTTTQTEDKVLIEMGSRLKESTRVEYGLFIPRLL